MPTRKELNQNILDNLADKFNAPYDDLTECALRPKGRGEGLVFNKEEYRNINKLLYDKTSEISEICQREALSDLGISDYRYMHIYEKQNPDHLSDEVLKKLYSEYHDIERGCKDREQMNVDNTIWKKAMCLAVGEELKAEISTAWVSGNILWGIQNHFISKLDKENTDNFGKLLNEVWRDGSYTPKEENPSKIRTGYAGQLFGSAKEIILQSNILLNRFAEKVLK